MTNLNNGQFIKTVAEMTTEERNALHLACTDTIEDIETVRCHYNKKGELIRVSVVSFTQDKKDRINAAVAEPNMIDVCKVASTKRSTGRQLEVFTAEQRKAIREVL